TVLRPAAEREIEIRDARPAVRERLAGWNADAFRCPADPDGGAAMELGRGVRLRTFRLACGPLDRDLDPRLLPRLPPGIQDARDASAGGGRDACGSRGEKRRPGLT